MKYQTIKQARSALSVSPWKHLERIVKTRYWNMTQWDYVDCYTIVMKLGV